MTYDILVADDEPLSLALLRSLVDDDKELRLIRACSDGAEAAAQLELCAPDIALLDIHMPGLSGIDIAKRWSGDSAPHIIFVTAHDEHALRSFELHVLDFLVKPVNRARFAEALARAKRKVDQDRRLQLTDRIANLMDEYEGDAKRGRASSPNCIVTRTGERLDWLEIGDIVWLEASNQYLTLHARDGRFVISQSLSGFLAEHCSRSLVQVHRSYAVNLDYVAQLLKRSNGANEVRMTNGAVIAISRSRRTTLPTLLKAARRNRQNNRTV